MSTLSVDTIINYYHDELKNSQVAKDYLKSRGVLKESVIKFKLGYCPPVSKYGDKDKFTNRIIFPIWDSRGVAVGWTGRTLLKGDRKYNPTYRNVRESADFKKKRILYAFNFAKEEIFNTETAILVEGQMDVVMLHQHGFLNTVATSGTSMFKLPAASLLARYGQKVYIVFDGDDSGRKATTAAEVLLKQVGVSEVFTVELPDKEDPASFILKYGKFKFEELLNEPR